MGQNKQARGGASFQSPEVWRHYDKRHIQGALANRSIFQDAEAELEGQDLHRSIRKRAPNPDLDSSNITPDNQMAALSVEGGLVAIKYGCHDSPEPLYPQGFEEMARQAVCDAAHDT